MNAVETLLPDEQVVLDKFRQAKAMGHSTLDMRMHFQDKEMVHIDFIFTEKYRPRPNGAVRTKEQG